MNKTLITPQNHIDIRSISDYKRRMARFTTTEAARRLGIHTDTLAHYVAVGKVPAPEMITLGTGKRVVHAWTEAEIEHVRKLLPKIANGRKTRYQKLRAAQKKDAPKQKARANKAVPRKRKTKKPKS